MKKRIVRVKSSYTKICSYCGKEVSYRHRHKPVCCPHCSATEWDKPKTEIMLFDLQAKYLVNRDSETLGKMYLILRDYARSLILKTQKYRFSPDILKEKASDAANRIIDYYLSKPGFSISASFAGYLRMKIREVLYEDKEEEDHESLNHVVGLGDDKELQDTLELLRAEPLFSHKSEVSDFDCELLLKNIMRMINATVRQTREQYDSWVAIAVLLGVKISLFGPQSKSLTTFYSLLSSNTVRRIVEFVIKEIYSFLKESQMDHDKVSQ